MKKFLLAFAVLGCGTAAMAQISVTSAAFPSAGDVNEVNRVRNISIPISASAGTSQTWDFSTLVADSTYNDTIQPASSDPASINYPNADIILPFGGLQTFADVSNSRVSILGTVFSFQGSPLPVTFSDPAEVAYAPMNAGDDETFSGAARFSFATASIPALQQLIDSLIASQGLPVSVDSLRVEIITTTNTNINAFGNVTLPGGNAYDVLRLKKTQNLDTQIYAYLTLSGFPVGWQNITGQLGGAGTGLPIGPQSFLSYEYQSNVVKAPVLTFNASTASPDTATSGQYKRGTGVAVQHILANSTNMTISPNPAVSTINVAIPALAAGEYRALVTDVAGRQVADLGNFLHTTGNSTAFNVDAVSNGIYWLTIVDSNGKMVATKPLAVAK